MLDAPQKDSQAFIAAFHSLNHLLQTTKAQIGPLPADLTSPSTKPLYQSYALIYGATIKLHSIFSYSDSGSRQACIDAAKAMLRPQSSNVTNMQQLGCVNPIMGVSLAFLLFRMSPLTMILFMSDSLGSRMSSAH